MNTERTTVGGEHRAGARLGAGPVLPPSTGAAGGEHGVVDGHRRALRCGGGVRAGGPGTHHTAQITPVRHTVNASTRLTRHEVGNDTAPPLLRRYDNHYLG